MSLNVTFVQEFATFAKNFKNCPDLVAAIDINTCLLLEICNRDAAKFRTALSLTHFVDAQATSDLTDANISIVIREFVSVGGDLATAECRLYGGYGEEGDKGRSRMKRCLKNTYGLIVTEPSGHFSYHIKISSDYLFRPDGVTFRRADMNYTDCSRDVYSQNIWTNGQLDTTKVKAFSDIITENYKIFERNCLQSTNRRALITTLNSKHDNAKSLSEKRRIFADIVRAYTVTVVDKLGMYIEGWDQQLVTVAPLNGLLDFTTYHLAKAAAEKAMKK